MPPKKTAPKWWQQPTTPWRKQLQDALASGKRGRVGLAWAVILWNGGKTHGDPGHAADDWGLARDDFYHQLKGTREPQLEMMEYVAEAVGKEFGVLFSGSHPFSVPELDGTGWCEPGDPRWEIAYVALRSTRPEMPTTEELRRRFPDLFPSAPDSGSTWKH